MADDNKNKVDKKVVETEFKVSMHCNGCEKTVAKAISKIKGVEKFMTDMMKHKVVVTGKNINPEKVMKKLKKKTGKRVEIVIKKEEKSKGTTKEEDPVLALQANPNQVIDSFLFDYFGNNLMSNMFNDENPNACAIM